MKNIYSLLIALVAVCTCSYGKTTGVSVPNVFPHYGSGGNNTPISPGTTKSRITAQTYLLFDGVAHVPYDSTTYSYSFGRGGQLTDEELDDNFVSFDHSYTYLFNPSLGTYRDQFHRQQTFNMNNKVQAYTCQSWNVAIDAWRDSARFLYTYNSDQTRLLKTVFQIWYGSIWADHVVYNNLFDATGKVTDMNSTALKMHFTYDVNNDVVQRTDMLWSPSSSWHYTERWSFTYDANHNMTSYTVEVYNNGWQNSEQDVFTYVGGDIVSTDVYSWDNNAWKMDGKHLFSYDANHNKLSDEWQVWNALTSSFMPDFLLQWTYNAFSQPLTYFSQTWDAPTSSWSYTTNDFLYRYYYQSYVPTAVADVTSFGSDLTLYPQPATNMLNMSLSGDSHQQYSVSVIDAQGRLLKVLQCTGSKQSIPVSDLPSGNYFLNVRTTDGSHAQQFTVSH